MEIHLIISAFFAGVLTFLAPCTLPLVPAFLGFISGASAKDLQHPEKSKTIRVRVVRNGFLFVLGFSIVFIFFGILFGIGGIALAKYRIILGRLGGIFVIFFGLYLLGAFEKIGWLSRFFSKEHRVIIKNLHPGSPVSSFIFGATFAFGWTPCVGPILGSVLLLASTTSTVVQGGILLTIFSIGLGIPFMVLAFGIAHASSAIKKISRILPFISLVGGIFLLILGVLLLSGSFSIWLSWFYSVFQFINYDVILKYL